jgi:hypothetical protein
MTGRPSLYSDETAEEICIRIACGEPLASVCRRKGMPAYRTVMRWLVDNEGFRHNYARAREDQANADADTVGDIALQVLAGKVEPQAARVAIDALKWAAAKRNPKKYGDRQEHRHTGANGGPIQTVDLTKLSGDELAQLEAIFGPLAGSGDDDASDQTGEGAQGQ